MTVAELKEELERFDDNDQVKIAIQPSWPMRARIENICKEDTKDGEEICWIAVSDGQDYGAKRIMWSGWDIFPEDEDEDE